MHVHNDNNYVRIAFHCAHILAEIPQFQDLVTIPNIEKAWKNFGLVVGVDHQLLEDIEARFSHPAKRKREMLRLVVKNGATWENIIQALCDVQLQDVAKSVCSIFSLNDVSAIIRGENVTGVSSLI